MLYLKVFFKSASYFFLQSTLHEDPKTPSVIVVEGSPPASVQAFIATEQSLS